MDMRIKVLNNGFQVRFGALGVEDALNYTIPTISNNPIPPWAVQWITASAK
jgi:hypothetical protein